MSQLVIRLPYPADAAPATLAYVLSTDGHTVSRHGHAEAALLPFGSAQDVVAQVPVTALSWHRVVLPPGSLAPAHRLRPVLEGLLEDSLLDAPEGMHFALAPGAVAGQPVWVAACHSAWLRRCLDELEQAGCTVGRIVPEFHPLPAGSPPSLHAIDSGTAAPDAALWVYCGSDQTSPPAEQTASPAQGGPSHTPSSSPPHMQAPGVLYWPLDTTQGHTPTPLSHWPIAIDTPPQHGALHVQADPAVAGPAEQQLRQSVQVIPTPQRWLHAAQSDWNLAQLAFANTGRDRLRKRSAQLWHHFAHATHWRAVRWGLAGLIVVQLIGLNVWAWQTRQHLHQQRQEVSRILQTTFPEIRAVVDAPVQMQRHVQLLRQGSGLPDAGDLDMLLAALARHAPDASLRGIEWNPPELRLKGLILPDDAQAAWQAELRQQQLQLQQDGTDWLLRPADRTDRADHRTGDTQGRVAASPSGRSTNL